MIYYPLSVLMLAQIRDILVISTPEDTPRFEQLLGDGSDLGLHLSYKVQERPEGLAQAFTIGEEFIANDPVCLILGDNIFFGHGLPEQLRQAINWVLEHNKACVFAYNVKEPQHYGVIQFDQNFHALNIEEKPEKPKSHYAVVGLYFYPADVVQIAKNIKPSARGELEITTVNEVYLKQNRLAVEVMGRGFAWLDTGTHSSLLEAGNFVRIVEERQGLKIGCIEEIAFRNKWISREKLTALGERLGKSSYGQYLLNLPLAP
jgi:glucose-1-phosphate thymidylyltransferase